ncbi:DUF3237 domain-containing protein [Arthrobacter sp. 9MFCol3.1]|uniref:DUF3237 domain-containing protein n=1 Tax=Arthrobacter sp. 9MFCol3.1 TaxID=1150398 RepID=UPI00047BB40E|nr:DUF3237 domain-containing protein [Arthrobacter sp. 9MFCol3.1]
MSAPSPDAPAAPGLTYLAELSVTVAEPIDIGPTPEGHRRVVPITGGTFSGPVLNGRVLPGGADYQLLRSATLTELDARYVLETDDGDRIFVHNSALRHGSARDIELLNSGAAVDGSRIYFRCWPRLTTASPALDWLNTRLMLGTGVRQPGRVVIRIFTVD